MQIGRIWLGTRIFTGQTAREQIDQLGRMGRQLGACQNSSLNRCDATNNVNWKLKLLFILTGVQILK